MGQGYSLTTLPAGGGIDIPELSDLSHEKSLGDARFMKAIRARHKEGLVVAKVIMKPFASMKFEEYIRQIMRERSILISIPNTLSYSRAFETSTNGYLVRQYTYSSLYDRLSTRPFLEDIEKRWLAFQLLNAVKECHAQNVYHGDIKTENALVTSWNWLLLSDFSASFKSCFLPEDNPADFSFFFDISGRRTCYLAPERFLSTGEAVEGRSGINWAMDIFSLGCVIAELFLESPIFNLSQLLNYRQGTFDPVSTYVNRIEDKDIRELVTHMIQLEPESRYSADEYLNFWRQRAFPEYFYSFLHQYMHLITDPSSGRAPMTLGGANLGESDDRISRVYNDYDKISYFLNYPNNKHLSQSHDVMSRTDSVFPLYLDVSNGQPVSSSSLQIHEVDGSLIFLNIVTSSLRSTARASARIQACELLLAFAEHIADELKLDRVLPFVISLVDDKSEVVKITALRTLAQLVSLVRSASPTNAYIFPEYIIPKLSDVVTPRRGSRSPVLVRMAYAQCMAPLAETASRFLDSTQALKSEGSLPSTDASNGYSSSAYAHHDKYDTARADLVRFFESQAKNFLTDPDTNVRRAFLESVSSLCVFFGSAKASDVILSHLNTYLNDKDWKLKCAFFDTIVGVAAYVGGNNLEEFILPLMIQALSDPEEFVVGKVLRSLSVMTELGLFQRTTLWELFDLVPRFTMHPNIWIREIAATFLSSATRFISVADYQCLIRPLLEPYLMIEPKDHSESAFLGALKHPLSRSVFDQANQWVAKTPNSDFWRHLQQAKGVNRQENHAQRTSPRNQLPSNLAKAVKNEDDQKWIARLRDAGLKAEDDFKFLFLGHHIWRTARRKTIEEADENVIRMNKLQKLAEMHVPLNIVTFENQRTIDEGFQLQSHSRRDSARNQQQTISDALLDASTSMDAQSNHQKPIQRQDQPIKARTEGLKTHESSNPPKVSSPLASSPLSSAPPGNSASRSVKDTSASDSNRSNSEPQAQLGLRNQDDEDGTRSSAAIRGNAINLMQRTNSGSKANAETSTTSTNAQGKLDGIQNGQEGPPSALALAQHQKALHPSEIRFRGEGGYNYSGRDPNVLRLLDSMYLENYPVDTVEFGPPILPIEQRLWNDKGSTMSDSRWRPQATMIAMFCEHSGPVSRVVVSPDHEFFLTGSHDGTVKVWDTARLERNVAHRSRQTHKHASGAKVTSLCFIENTHCFVSTASDGSVHVVKVECSETSQGTMKYSKPQLLRQWQLPGAPNTHAVWSEHYKADQQSVLLLATNDCKVYAIDLRTMSVLYRLDNPVDHGTPTCFCLGSDKQSKHHWILLGTSNGVLDLWDLRFRMRLRAFAFPGAASINRICLHPNRSSRKIRVCIAGGTGLPDITVWDLEKLGCKEVYRTAPVNLPRVTGDESSKPKHKSVASASTPANPSLEAYTPWNPDSSPRGTVLERFGAAKESQSDSASRSRDEPPENAERGPLSTSNRSIRALCVGARYSNALTSAGTPGNASQQPPEPRHGFFVTGGGGGADDGQKVRFWDMDRIEHSCIVSGLIGSKPAGSSEAGKDGKKTEQQAPQQAPQQPEYRAVGTAGHAAECVVYEEQEATAADEGDGAGTKAANGKKKSSSSSRSAGSMLLQSHLDCVLDVAVLEYPCHMIVSVDRSGVIFVFA